jgi:hypothetical protein
MHAITAKLVKSLGNSVREKDVEHAYWTAFQSHHPGLIEAVGDTDGVLKIDATHHVLLEVKHDWDFSKPHDVAKALIQALWYIKKLNPIPVAIFIGDENSCFCLPTGGVPVDDVPEGGLPKYFDDVSLPGIAA